MSPTRTISTTQLAKQNNMQTKELFALLAAKEYILRIDDHWELTDKGAKAGGE